MGFQLEIRDSSGTPMFQELSGSSEFSIGNSTRASGPENIRIADRSIGEKQFLLRRDHAGWKIVHVGGITPTFLGGMPLSRGEERRIGPGAKITVAGHSITLIEIEEQLDSISSVDAATGRLASEALASIAGKVHKQLIGQLKEMHGEISSDQSEEGEYFSSSVSRFLEENLLVLSEKAVRTLSLDEVELVASGALHRRAAEILIEGKHRPKKKRRVVGVEDGAIVRDLAQQLLAASGLSSLEGFGQILTEFESRFTDAYSARKVTLDEGTKRTIVREMLQRTVSQIVFGLGPIETLMDMSSIQEIMVTKPEQIFIDRDGLHELPYGFPSAEALMLTIERIVFEAGRKIDIQSPMVDARLVKSGSRVNAVIPPIALKGAALTIRKFPEDPLSLEKLEKFGSMTEAMRFFLTACVQAELNIVVSGGTGSGKTTLLNALSGLVDPSNRVVTIEDTAELKIPKPHVITLQARPPNSEETGEISIQELVKNALRMRPDRIIVGECRGAETLDMLQAMNTGHEGSMTTAHANSPQEMMLRLETMVQMGDTEIPSAAIRHQINAAVDIVVQASRHQVRDKKYMRTSHISEVSGIDPDSGQLIVEDIFRHRFWKDSDGKLQESFYFTGYLPKRIEHILNKTDFSWTKLTN